MIAQQRQCYIHYTITEWEGSAYKGGKNEFSIIQSVNKITKR